VTDTSLTLAHRVSSGDMRALSRAISVIEDGGSSAADVISELSATARRSPVTGITGPPGVGKSTLVSALIRAVRKRGASVGALCIDPTSRSHQGALLGDRVRMNEFHDDDRVYIRSMATRGALGGIARAARQALLLMDSAGLDELLLETVGVGQSEVAVRTIVDTVVLVVVPGMGDAIQLLKAGVMEIPDVIVVNKRDQGGAEKFAGQLRAMTGLGRGPSTPDVRIVKTDALSGNGIDELREAILEHRGTLDQQRRLEPAESEPLNEMLLELAIDDLRGRLASRLAADSGVLAQAVRSRRIDPARAAELLVDELLARRDSDPERAA
jgi:LAO/AO transport system kinase